MLRYGDRLVLSDLDIRRWTRITGFEPTAISTFADLESYVRECKRYYIGPSKDSAFIHWLIDLEFERCGGRAAEDQPLRTTLSGGEHQRAAEERELLWNIALDGDRSRRLELMKLLETPGLPRPD